MSEELAESLVDIKLTRQEDINTAERLIDGLATLYALKFTPDNTSTITQMIAEEHSAENHSSAFVGILQKHNELKKKEILATQGDAAYAQTKGHTFEVTDPNKAYKLVSKSAVHKYTSRGYSVGDTVLRDRNDMQSEPLVKVYSAAGGNYPWLQGVLTLIDSNIGGINPFTGKAINAIGPTHMNRINVAEVLNNKQNATSNLINERVSNSTPVISMVPAYAPSGELKSFRYTASNADKDAHLSRNTEVGNVLGHWQARLKEEDRGSFHNDLLIKHLNAQYEESTLSERENNFITISANSTDPIIKELYALMPLKLKQTQKRFFVRKAEYNNSMGYRKLGVTNLWDSDAKMAKIAVEVAEIVLGKDAARILKEGGTYVGGLVKDAKDFIVIRSVVVPTVNILSNVASLVIRDVSYSDIVKYSVEGVKAAKDYRRLTRKLFLLEEEYKRTASSLIQTQIIELKEQMKGNPIMPLVDAGLMPAVVEDLSLHNDLFSYKRGLMEKLDDVTDKLPQTLNDIGKEALINRDSKIYGVLNEALELGDFVAKYTLYNHYTAKGMSQQVALEKVATEFIDYGALSSKELQYLNDIGMTHFLNILLEYRVFLVI